MVDKEKIRQKLHFMRRQLRELKRFQAMDLEEFCSDPMYEAAATRMLQVTIEAMLDTCSHIIAREGWGLPKTYAETVDLASKNGLIPTELSATFKAMARFRNRVVRLYDAVDASKIWKIIQKHLEDFRPFIGSITERYLDTTDSAEAFRCRRI